jgi:hypothetical protein
MTDSRDGMVLICHLPLLRCTAVVPIQTAAMARRTPVDCDLPRQMICACQENSPGR